MPLRIIVLLLLVTMTGVTGLQANESAGSGDARSIYGAAAGNNRFYIKATGDIAYENAIVIPKRTPSQEVIWRCTGDALRIGYSWGVMMKPGWEVGGVAVETPVAPGQTGTFVISEMGWTYGQETMPGQPADSTFKVPRGFEGGGGELRLTNHVADGGEKRIQGVAEGEVKAKNSDLTVQLYMEFDLNRACK